MYNRTITLGGVSLCITIHRFAPLNYIIYQDIAYTFAYNHNTDRHTNTMTELTSKSMFLPPVCRMQTQLQAKLASCVLVKPKTFGLTKTTCPLAFGSGEDFLETRKSPCGSAPKSHPAVTGK